MSAARLAVLCMGPLAVFFLVYGIGSLRAGRGGSPRVLIEALQVGETGAKARQGGFYDRRVRPAALWLARRFARWKGLLVPMNLPRLLDYAGHPYGITAEEFFGLRILGAGIGGLLGLELGLIQRSLGGALVSGLILGAGGLFLAQLWLQAEASRRQRAISLGLPDVMDLLAIAVGAGLGLDEALVRTVETMEGPITEEFGTLIRELRLGVPRAEALGHLIDRNRSQELRAIVGALIQGHELGTPIRDVLHDQAASMRARRLQLAKEAAAEVSPRIALVLGLVMAPAVACLFIMILGYGLVDKLGPLFNLGSPIEALP